MMTLTQFEWLVLMDALNGSRALVDRPDHQIFAYKREIRIQTWEAISRKAQESASAVAIPISAAAESDTDIDNKFAFHKLKYHIGQVVRVDKFGGKIFQVNRGWRIDAVSVNSQTGWIGYYLFHPVLLEFLNVAESDIAGLDS